uniref:Uncharacterized protein n=1 Tax=viral metagenome TaxID=1070528 RepID=A0A6C0ERS4_9ZZZZ
MDFIYKLPHELIIHIYEFNPEHREKMKWVLKDIEYTQYCEVCDKKIIKRIWCWRGCDMICCSSECLDNY